MPRRTSNSFADLIDHTTLSHRASILFSLVPNLSPNLCALTASCSLQHMQSTPDPCLTNFSNVRTSRVPKLRLKKKDFILKSTQIARKTQISILSPVITWPYSYSLLISLSIHSSFSSSYLIFHSCLFVKAYYICTIFDISLINMYMYGFHF